MQEEVEIDIESGQTSNEFINDFYEDIVLKQHRDPTIGIYESDLLLEMFFVAPNYWWMRKDHPIALMIFENGYDPIKYTHDETGDVLVYSDSLVKQCQNDIIELCVRYGKKIIKNGGV